MTLASDIFGFIGLGTMGGKMATNILKVIKLWFATCTLSRR
jgi:3-hydroxyisobutyrate dehydrogenase-like beta-hydroxyacid dehydrogenase